jgi:hypothetical protein
MAHFLLCPPFCPSVGTLVDRNAACRRIVATERVSLCVPDEKLTAFLELDWQSEAAPCKPSFLCGCVLEGNVGKETVVRFLISVNFCD